jgi:hypothetical protein
MWLFLDIKMFNVEKMSNMKNGRPNKATNHLYSVLAGRSSNHLKRVKCLNINVNIILYTQKRFLHHTYKKKIGNLHHSRIYCNLRNVSILTFTCNRFSQTKSFSFHIFFHFQIKNIASLR